MAERPLAELLSADLPEDWTAGQIVAPTGMEAGLSEQHGYNYLMAAVNAAQRAVNQINQGFDDISGKRTCRVVVGTSTSGWTQADCDYLCDGVDDQEEINAAVAAVREKGGGEIAILSGEYRISQILEIESREGEEIELSFAGEAGAAVLKLSAGIGLGNNWTTAQRFALCFSGITFDCGESVGTISSSNVFLSFESCRFRNASVSVHCFDAGSLSFKGNTVEADHKNNVYDMLNTYGVGGSGQIITGNVFRDKRSAEGIRTAVRLYARGEDGTNCGLVFFGNMVDAGSGSSKANVVASGDAVVANNFVGGASISIGASSACVGNRVENGNIVSDAYTIGGPVVGNSVSNGCIQARGCASIVGNNIAAPSGVAAIQITKAGSNDIPGELSPNVTGNTISAGGVGIHLSNSMAGEVLPTGAMITCNRIFGCAASIKIESNWSGCLVTGNVIDLPVANDGTGNIVRLNSDDVGGGGAAGVSSFNGRAGAVRPMGGDYTAAMVGAIPADAVSGIQVLSQTEYDALPEKSATTLYVVKG